jgi:peptide-methionine (S)-S-oxide reductase
MSMDWKKATFSAGCFWGVEEAFANLEGVISTQVGYTGGRTEMPTYEEVCRGDTGHAESVELTFDPTKINYEALVRFFFEIHDPTTKDRQGPDHGFQYRSAIFYHDEEQRRIVRGVIADVSSDHDGPIVTELTKAGRFYRAEEYHQRYISKRGIFRCHS